MFRLGGARPYSWMRACIYMHMYENVLKDRFMKTADTRIQSSREDLSACSRMMIPNWRINVHAKLTHACAWQVARSCFATLYLVSTCLPTRLRPSEQGQSLRRFKKRYIKEVTTTHTNCGCVIIHHLAVVYQWACLNLNPHEYAKLKQSSINGLASISMVLRTPHFFFYRWPKRL